MDKGRSQMWSNLLDTDAVVAGRPRLVDGPEPEPSTTDVATRWWRLHWADTQLAGAWTCTPGAIARTHCDGTTVVTGSNPTSEQLAVRCTVGNDVKPETDTTPWRLSSLTLSVGS